MNKEELFQKTITAGYACKGEYILLGGAMLDGQCIPGTAVTIPLKTMNRHGLVAGATGTGKTKTVQVIAEQLSENGVPVLLMDLKGDLSGLARPGETKDFILERHKKLGFPYVPKAMPVELMTISNEKGVRLRATITEFGPVMLSKLLDLNDVQGGVVSLIFKYCDDNRLPLIDLKDFKKMLQYTIQEGKALISSEYGNVSSTSVNTIIRKIIELEQQGADQFFGEPSFNMEDLLRTNDNGNGYISIIRLTDMQEKPKLFSTFMLSMLAEIYATFPERGDHPKPKLVIFVDEAHLVFKTASQALIDQIEAIVKLIRSKGVGIYFCTQNPTDVPDAILSQLGLKVQHALRAFTAKDRKEIKQTAENYPLSDFYRTDQVLTSLGIGEALVTALNEKGIPTPLAATYLRAPVTRMDILTTAEIDRIVQDSELVALYRETVDRNSAYEMLSRKIEAARDTEQQEKNIEAVEKAKKTGREKSTIESITENTMVRQVGRTLAREIVRGLLGVLGVSTATRRRRK
jgi:DNA helicase HerA-like ATPase